MVHFPPTVTYRVCLFWRLLLRHPGILLLLHLRFASADLRLSSLAFYAPPPPFIITTTTTATLPINIPLLNNYYLLSPTQPLSKYHHHFHKIVGTFRAQVKLHVLDQFRDILSLRKTSGQSVQNLQSVEESLDPKNFSHLSFSFSFPAMEFLHLPLHTTIKNHRSL